MISDSLRKHQPRKTNWLITPSICCQWRLILNSGEWCAFAGAYLRTQSRNRAGRAGAAAATCPYWGAGRTLFTCEGELALRKTSSAFLLLSKGPPLAPETREDSPNAVRPRPPGWGEPLQHWTLSQYVLVNCDMSSSIMSTRETDPLTVALTMF